MPRMQKVEMQLQSIVNHVNYAITKPVGDGMP